MMMTYTQTDIDRMKAAIAKGARVVQRGDERVEYRGIPEMRRVLAEMEAEVNGTVRAFTKLVPTTSRGL